MTSPEEQLVERFYYDGWNKADENVMRQVLHEHIKFRGAFGKKIRGHDAVIRYMRDVQSALGRCRFEIEDCIVAAPTKAAVRLTCRGVHKRTFFGVEGTGHEVSWSISAFFHFADGRIIDIWVLGDIDNLKNQIGALPDAVPF